jgi:hypothetical protein
MKLRVNVTPIIEATIKLVPFKVEAPNHGTLMEVIASFISENKSHEVYYNCAKINRKRIDENNVVPSKWTAQIYIIEPELLDDLFVRQNPRSFEVSFKPLKPIVHRQRTLAKPKEVKIIQEYVEIIETVSNAPITTQGALV